MFMSFLWEKLPTQRWSSKNDYLQIHKFLFRNKIKSSMILFWQARASLIDKQYEADREKLHKIRLLLVRIFKSHFLKNILVDFGGFYCVDPPTMLITFFSLSWCPFSNMCLHDLVSYINFPNLKTFNFYLTWVFACITFF